MSKSKGGFSVFTALQKVGRVSRQVKDLESMLRYLARQQGIDLRKLRTKIVKPNDQDAGISLERPHESV
jgi:hypothetical protein